MFVKIGEAQSIAEGEMRVVDLGGTRVNITHAGESFYGFEDTCTHSGCSLARGELDGTVVTCGCHGSQFDVTTGAVLRGPAQRPVRPIPVRVENGELLAESPSPES